MLQKMHASPLRPCLFVASLGMLMLPSCEPAGGNSDAGNPRPRDERAEALGRMVPNEAGNAQLAAQDSVGKPPPPRHLADGVDDTCPVHHEKMRIREIPIIFEDTADSGAESEILSGMARFPFGAEKIVSSGNALLPGAALTARVYQCASCVTARRAADAKRAQPEPPAGPK
jgi:hypothetical protein